MLQKIDKSKPDTAIVKALPKLLPKKVEAKEVNPDFPAELENKRLKIKLQRVICNSFKDIISLMKTRRVFICYLIDSELIDNGDFQDAYSLGIGNISMLEEFPNDIDIHEVVYLNKLYLISVSVYTATAFFPFEKSVCKDGKFVNPDYEVKLAVYVEVTQ